MNPILRYHFYDGFRVDRRSCPIIIVWNIITLFGHSTKKSYIDKLEKVQKRATKMIPKLRKMPRPIVTMEH